MTYVKTTIQDRVLHVTLARPERMNAFDSQMIQELKKLFASAPKQGNVSAIVLRGEGKSFCAGADLEYMKAMVHFSKQENARDSERLFDMFEAIRSCPLPVIAHVHGAVFGGGLGLVAACDLVAAQADAQFCFSEVRLGLIPAVISSFVLSKMNPGFARAMMISGRVFSASDAVNAGLAHFSGSKEMCESWVSETSKQLGNNGPGAMAKTKKLCDHLLPVKVKAQKKHTTKVIAEQRVSKEGQEGIGAFLEKRKPQWSKL